MQFLFLSALPVGVATFFHWEIRERSINVTEIGYLNNPQTAEQDLSRRKVRHRVAMMNILSLP